MMNNKIQPFSWKPWVVKLMVLKPKTLRQMTKKCIPVTRALKITLRHQSWGVRKLWPGWPTGADHDSPQEDRGLGHHPWDLGVNVYQGPPYCLCLHLGSHRRWSGKWGNQVGKLKTCRHSTAAWISDRATETWPLKRCLVFCGHIKTNLTRPWTFIRT